MTTANLDRLRQEIEALSANERQELLDWLLGSRTQPSDEATDENRERAFQERMLREGFLSSIPSGAPLEDFEPVVVEGTPLSVTLIDDREPR
jgi:hypothetical protein